MSEFTAGVLYRTTQAEILNPLLEELTTVMIADYDTLNDKWWVATLYGEIQFSVAAPLDSDREAVNALLALRTLSRHAPLLYFYNAEDHGWGYRILHQGEETARFDQSYESGELPVNDPSQAPNYEQFAVFGFPAETLAQLQQLLHEASTQPPFPDDEMDDEYVLPVERFKALLDLQEMSWIG